MNASTTTTILTGLLSLCLISSAAAADFSGNLKGVTITDSQSANKPPTAAFTYTVSGETVTLNATGSSDPDGTIAQYHWDLGGGKIKTGQSVVYENDTESNAYVTLTVVDNLGAIAITGQKLTLQKSCETIFYQVDDPLTNTFRVSSEDYYTYGGGQWRGVDSNICGAQFFIAAVIGDISSKRYKIQIFSTDENNKITVLKGDSETLSGSSVTNGWGPIFKFPNTITLLKGDAVVLTEESNAVDGSNYIIIAETQTTGSSLKEGIWGSSLLNNRSFDRAVLARLYK